MAKLNLDDISSRYGTTTKINNNNAAIEAALENTLSRDGTSPNEMNAPLDMNSNKIANLGAPSAATDAARLIDLQNSYSVATVPSAVGQTGKGLVSNGTILAYATVLGDASSLNASNLLTGTIPNARFPATLPAANGSALTALNATNISSGTIATTYLPATVARTDALANFTAGIQNGGNEVGYRDIVAVAASITYTISATDRGKLIISTAGGFSLPTTGNDVGFAIGAAVSLCNNSVASMSLACPTGMTLYIAGSATGGLATARNIAARGLVTLVKIASASWLMSGSGIS